jgi:hypothetical protein
VLMFGSLSCWLKVVDSWKRYYRMRENTGSSDSFSRKSPRKSSHMFGKLEISWGQLSLPIASSHIHTASTPY